MPQNAIVRADGTGDYISLQTWVVGERDSDYGSAATARLDGFYDYPLANQLAYVNFGKDQTLWPNGARIEAFNPDDAFNGVARRLCGFTTIAHKGILNYGHHIEMDGIEVHNTQESSYSGRGIAYENKGGFDGGYVDIRNCLFRSTITRTFAAVAINYSIGPGLTNCVLDSSDQGRPFRGDINLTGCSLFGNQTHDFHQGTVSDTVAVNYGAGKAFNSRTIQSNNASSDGTADNLDNIVLADNFMSDDIQTSEDYRRKSGSPIALAGIGFFIQPPAPPPPPPPPPGPPNPDAGISVVFAPNPYVAGYKDDTVSTSFKGITVKAGFKI